MADLKKFTAVLTATATLELPDEFGQLLGIALKSSSDTSVQLQVADYVGFNVANFASGNYTTRSLWRTGPLETDIFDAGGDASANLEHTPIGNVFEGPLTFTVTGMSAGELVVELFYRPLRKLSLTASADGTQVLNLPDQGFALLKSIGVTSSADTSVAIVVDDANGKQLASIASGNFTSGYRMYTADLETDVLDVAGDPSADTEGNEVGILAEGGFSVAVTGLASGTTSIDLYFEQ